MVDRAKENYEKYYELSNGIGNGEFGIVYKGKDKSKEESREIKVIDLQKIAGNLINEYDGEDLKKHLELCFNGFITEMDMLNKSLKAQFKSVERMNPKYLIFLNDEDLKSNLVTIKDNLTKEEEKVKLNEIVEYLDTHM